MGYLIKQQTQEDRVNQHLALIDEAQQCHSIWRMDSWQDSEFKDGIHWNAIDIAALKKKGINPITINRVFPVLNLILGNYLNNQRDVIAKGRTKEDNELGQTMTESLAYVNDQNNGTYLQRVAFEDQITAGFGGLEVGYHPDPRREKVWLRQHPWYNIWWDPYASPWMNKDTCRYAFTASWKDIEDLKIIFPKKAKEIEETAGNLTARSSTNIYDLGDEVEDHKRLLASSFWVSTNRTRIRPVEFWYTRIQMGTFARMYDGSVFDLDSLRDIRQEIEVVQNAREVIKVPIKKMWVQTLLDTLELQNVPSPYAHDEFPYVPFVGYLDRFNFPYGIPRQIKEQNMEVDKRRSMALALISNRRVILEEGSARNEKEAFIEANRHDGFIVMKKGKMKSIQIEDLSALAKPQIDLMLQSEKEINEISGPNAESLQYDIPRQSGVALEQRKQSTSTVTASLLDNARLSQKMLGERVMALVQSEWTDEKILRVVDRLTGAEKFVAINERILNTNTGAIEIKNNITEGRFDVIIATKPITDTVREKNMELLFAAINKASPEAMPILLDLAFELSDLPNKDQLLTRLRAITGVTPLDEDLTMAEQKQKQLEEYQAKLNAEQEAREIEKESKRLDQEEQKAKVINLNALSNAAMLKAQTEKQKVDQDGWAKGQEITLQMLKGGKE